MDTLETLINDPEPITIKGKKIIIKEITLSQIPKVNKIAKSLFQQKEGSFLMGLTDDDIVSLKKLLLETTNLTEDELELTTADFLKIFSAILDVNDGFFLTPILYLKPTTVQPTGPASSSNSSIMDTSQVD